MTKEETKKAIEVMQAYLDGKKVEWTMDQGEKWWTNENPGPNWNWAMFEYRIKPEPMEIEVWVSPDERVIEYNAMEPGWTKKKFREVIE